MGLVALDTAWWAPWYYLNALRGHAIQEPLKVMFCEIQKKGQNTVEYFPTKITVSNAQHG